VDGEHIAWQEEPREDRLFFPPQRSGATAAENRGLPSRRVDQGTNPSGLTPCNWTGVREQGTKTGGLDDAGELSNALPDWGRLIVLAADAAHAANT